MARQHVDSCCKQVLQSKMDRQYCTDTVQLNIVLQRVTNATEQRVPTKNAAASRVQHCFELILVSSCLRSLVQVALPGLSHLCRRPSNVLRLPCFYSSCPLLSLPGLPSHRPGGVRRLHTHMVFLLCIAPALPWQKSSVPPRVGSQEALIDLDLFVCCCGRDGVADVVVHEVWCCAAARGAPSKLVAAGSRWQKKPCASFRRAVAKKLSTTSTGKPRGAHRP